MYAFDTFDSDYTFSTAAGSKEKEKEKEACGTESCRAIAASFCLLPNAPGGDKTTVSMGQNKF